jgi:hypothetical protein
VRAFPCISVSQSETWADPFWQKGNVQRLAIVLDSKPTWLTRVVRKQAKFAVASLCLRNIIHNRQKLTAVGPDGKGKSMGLGLSGGIHPPPQRRPRQWGICWFHVFLLAMDVPVRAVRNKARRQQQQYNLQGIVVVGPMRSSSDPIARRSQMCAAL